MLLLFKHVKVSQISELECTNNTIIVTQFHLLAHAVSDITVIIPIQQQCCRLSRQDFTVKRLTSTHSTSATNKSMSNIEPRTFGMFAFVDAIDTLTNCCRNMGRCTLFRTSYSTFYDNNLGNCLSTSYVRSAEQKSFLFYRYSCNLAIHPVRIWPVCSIS